MRKTLAWTFVFLSFLLLTHPILAQSADTTATQEAAQHVDYSLPYPGLLPDNPFYPLKAFRDAVVGMLISNPVKKAEFYLLEADKHLSAGMLLIQSPMKEQLAETTIAKGENYADGCLQQVILARKQGYNSTAVLHSLDTALKKHAVVVEDMRQQVSSKQRAGFVQILNHITSLQKKVKQEITKD